MRVHIVCQRPLVMRILQQMADYLVRDLGWSISPYPDPDATVNYFFNYADGWWRFNDWAKTPIAAYFTHYESDSHKAALWDSCAGAVALRVCNNEEAARRLRATGLTARVMPVIELERYTPATEARPASALPVVGLSGWANNGPRKGAHLVAELLDMGWRDRAEWKASGAGWPVPTVSYPLRDLPAFYQSLDYLLCSSLEDAGPAGPVEALACGVPVIVPDTVGLCAELPECAGVYHYARGDVADMSRALERAMDDPRPRGTWNLHGLAARYSRANWSEGHRIVFEMLWGGL
jgi:hypothetical protein